VEACTLFEQAFGLTWNDTLELYLVNSSQHNTLLAQNANVTFTMGNLTAGASVNITLPYAAFDLNVSSPIVPNPTNYFPLKRAANSTQYTLGRTFFQEALVFWIHVDSSTDYISYVTADYDRRNFSVSQCNWQPDAQSNIVPILPPAQESSNSGSGSGSLGTPINKSITSSPPVGAIAGGVVGGVVVIIAIAILLWFFCIKPRRRRAEAAAAAAAASPEPQPRPRPEEEAFMKPELDSEEVRKAHEMEAHKNQWISEVDAEQARIYEMEGKKVIYEMDGKKGIWAVEADGTPIEIHEMPAREEVAHEMRGQRDSIEVAEPGRPRWSWEMTDARQHSATFRSPEGSTIAEESPNISSASPRSIAARISRRPIGDSPSDPSPQSARSPPPARR